MNVEIARYERRKKNKIFHENIVECHWPKIDTDKFSCLFLLLH